MKRNVIHTADGGHPTLTDDELERIKDDAVLEPSDFGPHNA